MLRGVATAVAALVFAGCNFSLSISENTAGDDAAKMPDGRTIDGPPDDIDGDGVKNVSDNCPTVENPMQYNEDGDGTGDECDPCPQLSAAADDVDGDGDKIGNGCDPHPTVGGDALAYWNGFHVASAALPTTMTLLHGDPARWTVSGGSLVFTDGGDDWGMPVVNVGKTNHTVDSTFQITADFIGASAAGVMVDIAANDSDGFDCQARVDSAGQRELWRRNPQSSTGDGWDGPLAVGGSAPNGTYRITMQRAASDFACKTALVTQSSIIDLNNSTDSLGNTRAGLFARNVDVAFRYIAVYTSP